MNRVIFAVNGVDKAIEKAYIGCMAMKNFEGRRGLEEAAWTLTHEEKMRYLRDLLADHRLAQKLNAAVGNRFGDLSDFTRAKVILFLRYMRGGAINPKHLELVEEN